MRILLISQYFFPETGATSNRVYSLAKHFKEKGHQVRIIAEKPNHPQGIFFESYTKGVFLDENYKGIPVTYTWVFTRSEKGFLGRIFFYVSFMMMAVAASLRQKENYDVILATSPPLFVGLSGWAVAKIKGGKFVFDVRDLWPDVAVEMGLLNNEFAIKSAQKFERFLYKSADLITTVTPSFKEAIAKKRASLRGINVITNGTDPGVFKMETNDRQLRKHLGLDDQFYVSYVGNVGLAQGLEHIIESAVQLQNKGHNDIIFLIIGEGPKKAHLENLVTSKRLKNVIFVDRVPLEKAAKYMNVSNILLVPLADDPIYAQFIPSKLFDSMAASKPVLLSVDGESRKILDASRGGMYYQAENTDQLTKKILWLKAHPQEAQQMGERGRRFVIKNYTRKAQSQKMLELFQNLF